MVRMNPLNDMEGDAAEGRGDESSAASHKRSRSSLDYKGDPTADKIIPQDKSQLFDVDARGGSAQRQPQDPSAPPAAELESIFQGMTPEEVLVYLTEHRELARQLGYDAQNLGGGAQAKSSTVGGGSSRKAYRTELLKNQGFPFVQWAIVLVVLGLGFYRLYKAVKPPATAVAAKQKVKRKGGAGKGTAKASSDDVVLSKVLAEFEESGDEAHAKSKGAGAKKAKKKVPQQQPKKAKPTKSQQPASSKDGEAVGDSDSEEEAPPPVPPARKSKSSKAAASVAAPAPAPQDDGEWQTVRGGKSSAAAATNGVGKPKSLSPPNGDAAEPTPAAPESSAADAKKKAKKKKKKAGSESSGAPVSSEGQSGTETAAATDNDEALAIRLQEEENAYSAVEEDDVWAEVTSKKKKDKTKA